MINGHAVILAGMGSTQVLNLYCHCRYFLFFEYDIGSIKDIDLCDHSMR